MIQYSIESYFFQFTGLEMMASIQTFYSLSKKNKLFEEGIELIYFPILIT